VIKLALTTGSLLAVISPKRAVCLQEGPKSAGVSLMMDQIQSSLLDVSESEIQLPKHIRVRINSLAASARAPTSWEKSPRVTLRPSDLDDMEVEDVGAGDALACSFFTFEIKDVGFKVASSSTSI